MRVVAARVPYQNVIRIKSEKVGLFFFFPVTILSKRHSRCKLEDPIFIVIKKF